MKLVCLAVAAASGMLAGTVTLTMDEVPQQYINGLTVTKGGESFTFSDPGNTLQYDFTVPGTQDYLANPGIAGGVEPFGVNFSIPVDSVQFGLAETSIDPLDGVGVILFDGSTEVLSTTFDLIDTGHPAVENLFTWTGQPGQEATSIEIDPAAITNPVIGPDGPVSLAGIDNLSVDPVPEPASLWLALCGVALGLPILRGSPGKRPAMPLRPTMPL